MGHLTEEEIEVIVNNLVSYRTSLDRNPPSADEMNEVLEKMSRVKSYAMAYPLIMQGFFTYLLDFRYSFHDRVRWKL